MAQTDTTDPRRLEEDTVYRHSVREAIVILSMWVVCFVYTCTYCYLFGYLSHEGNPLSTGPALGSWLGPLEAFDREPASLTTPLGLGIPDWVFYGIAMPWALCILATFWFCLFFFKEDDLGEEGSALPAGGADG